MNAGITLSDRHLEIVRAVLAPYRDKIRHAAVFGSRATGRARPNSDLDLVLYGTLDPGDQAELWADFEESDLPITVDVLFYDQIEFGPLRRHIDRVAKPLWDGGAT